MTVSSLSDFSQLSARAIRDGIVSGEFSAAEIASAAYSRIDALEPDIHAFNELTPQLAEEAAARIDAKVAAGELLPPLAGVPAAFKDNMNLVGTHTTCSSRILKNYQSVYDCSAVRRLLDAGALPIGKCNMDEFAFGSSTENSAFGPTRNPWDLDRVPGGSSGGSAAAVAAGMVTVSLGSDTGGSIRQPGALTGTVAMKPTYGRVSRYGIVAFASSLDQIGPFTRSVEDAAMVLNAIAGHDDMDATSVREAVPDFTVGLGDGVKGLRVGVVRDMVDLEGCAPEVRAATESALATLATLGAEVGEIDLPMSQHGLAAYYIIGPAEASSNLARFDGIRYGYRAPDAADVLDLYMRSRAEGFGAESIRRIMLGTHALSSGYYDAYYGTAQKTRTLITREFAAAFERFDVLITPTAPTVAFKIGEKAEDPLSMYLSDVYTIPLNLAGLPGISVPCAKSATTGLPIGVQIIGNHFDESTMLRVASALEAALALDMTPPLTGI
ncbi:MAG: Asp-tRNA(Asn)/Glu-tRNA(Gln) amidotransferase subunit GatA [Actinomycetota bacterium]|nr:MAG: glutamyl-tRNA(Gln) amidotransferase A [Actinomycetota bacterium]MDO8949230.1 Asp-tRNA(Asn)/Glu-tRNA(Gln) amidotransferase subunit GatA [Actinomycetota bacterium]MDP3631216.1 Asp-tRNA(Asn)/Glu-tRNA(Gln) amidotransferase subunit GatA [Actinomycetota bacterium]